MSSTSSERRHAAWVDIIAGGFGGALAKSLLSPFQRIVVLQQLGQHKHYGTLRLARHVYETDGLKGFWRGNLTSMLIRVPYSGIQFLLYSKLKFFFQEWLDHWQADRLARQIAAQRNNTSTDANSDDEKSHALQPTRGTTLVEKFIMKCGAGGISATIAGAAVYPGEVVRLRLMSGERQFRGIFHTCGLIYKETNSLRNFYRGLGASLLQRVPDILISFATYETVKYGLLDSPHATLFKDNYKLRNIFATVLGGSAAALASIAVAFPLDVAKRRIGMSGKGKEKVVYRGVVDCLHRIYVAEGVRGWYAGSAVEAVRCVPQVVLMWFFIEGIQRYLTEHYVADTRTLRERSREQEQRVT